jgi:hypothetical protein
MRADVGFRGGCEGLVHPLLGAPNGATLGRRH